MLFKELVEDNAFGIAFDGAVVGEAFGQAERVDAKFGQLFDDLLFGGDDKAFGEEAAVAEEKREFHRDNSLHWKGLKRHKGLKRRR